MNYYRLVALVFSGIFAARLLIAETVPGSFNQIDCEGGGWFEQVIPHPSGRLYGRTDVGGMYRSDDHGDSWQFLSGDMPSNACYYVQGVAVSSNPDVVYQATGVSYYESDPGRGVWKSTNGGTTWTQVLAGVNFSGNDFERWGNECLVIAPDNDSELWAGSRGEGLRHSINAGANWTNVAPAVFDTPNVIIAGITIHPSAPNTIWVAGTGGVWVSTNRGVDWTPKIAATRIYRVAVKPDGTAFAAGTNGSNNVLYRLTAAGSATEIYSNFSEVFPYAAFDGDQLATVQVLGNGHVWTSTLFEFTGRSLNNGEDFELMPMTLTGPLPAWSRNISAIEGGRNGIIEDPTDPNRLFLGGGYAPFRSTDGGATWHFINNGIGETVAWRANFHPTDPNRVWLPLADLGVTTVSDGGASGVSNGYIAPHFPYPDDIVMFSHRVLISAGKVIAPGGEQGNHRARIYQTTDNGVNWTKLAASGLPTSNNREIIETVASKDAPDDFLVFTGGPLSASEGGIYRTVNGGGSFTRSTGFPMGYDPGQEFYWNVSLERDATDNAVRYALLRNDGFWKSTNRGASWTKPAVQPNGSFGRLRVDAVTGRIWVGHAFGLEYSATGGNSWVFLSGAFTSVAELDAHDSRIAVIGRRGADTTDHIYVSDDNGASWDEITRPGNRFANAQAVAVDPWRPGTVWISTGGRSIARFTPGTPFELTTAVSRKMHGAAGVFDINLPLTGQPGVECRSSGGNHTLVVSFTDDVVSGNASVTSGAGVAGSPSFAGKTMTVNLSGVADVQKITVTLSNVTNTSSQVLPGTAVSMNLLIGDTNGSKTVNSTDIGQTKTQSGVPVTTANFRQDVTPNGTTNASDIGLVKSRSGASVP
jgi:hypothetical protein